MQSLALLPWQQTIASWWANVQQAGRMPHALMLSGPQGSGKRHLADQICQALYADNAQAQALYQAGTHPDFFRVSLEEKKKEIAVAQIRDLSSRVTLTSQLDGWRIVWIDPADRLSRGAANGLLKILEEPPKQVLFILMVDELQRVLPTIRSRCQHLKLQLPAKDAALACLAQQTEVAGLTPDVLQDWLALCHGSPLRVLDALSNAEDDTPDLLNLADQRQASLQQLIHNQIDVVSCADSMLGISADADLHLKWLQGFALDLLKCAQGLNINFCENRRASELLSRLAPHVAAEDVLNYLVRVGQIRRAVRGNVNAELSLQAALMPWLNQLKASAIEPAEAYSLAS